MSLLIKPAISRRNYAVWGPLGLLITAFASVILADPAFANVCTQVRPGWDPSGGPMSLIGEASYLIFSPGGIMLLLMTPLAMRFQKFWFSVVIATSALLVAGLRYYQTIQPVGIDVDAIKEGCIGEPWLGITFMILLAAIIMGWFFFGPKREVAS